MIINNINPMQRNALTYNLAGNRTNKSKGANIDFKDYVDVQKNKYITDEYNNYSKNIFMDLSRKEVIKKLSIKNAFTEIDSEFPDCREFITYRSKVKENGMMILDVRIENCPKGTIIDEKEFEDAMRKVIATVDKIEYAFDKMGYRASDSFHIQLDYNQATGKINVTDMIKDAPNLINTIADQIYSEYLENGSISIEDLKKIKANLEKIKQEMYDFFMNLADSD